MIKRSKNDKIGINSLITQILSIEIAQTKLGSVEHKCLRKLTKFQQNCYMGSIITIEEPIEKSLLLNQHRENPNDWTVDDYDLSKL